MDQDYPSLTSIIASVVEGMVIRVAPAPEARPEVSPAPGSQRALLLRVVGWQCVSAG